MESRIINNETYEKYRNYYNMKGVIDTANKISDAVKAGNMLNYEQGMAALVLSILELEEYYNVNK